MSECPDDNIEKRESQKRDWSVSACEELSCAISKYNAESDEWIQRTYDELRTIARSILGKQRATGEGPESASLVHSVYLRLVDSGFFSTVENRAHFFGAVARAMKQALVDRARRRHAHKRGGQMVRLPIDQVVDRLENRVGRTLPELNEAIEQLSASHPKAALVLQCKVFGQMTTLETAAQLGLSPTTVTTYFRFAQSRLRVLLDAAN